MQLIYAEESFVMATKTNFVFALNTIANLWYIYIILPLILKIL